MKRFERYFPFIVILTAVFFSLSCSLGSVGLDQKPTGTAVASPEASPLPPAQAAATVPLPAAPSPARSSDQPFPTVPALGGGTTIDSYSLALVYHAEGKDSKGSPYGQNFTIAEDVIKSQKADHFKISGLTALPGLGSGDLDIYQLNTSLYMYSAAQNGQNASCLTLSGSSKAIDPNTMNPAAMMKNITVDKLLESGVMVNGIQTNHYTLENSDLAFGMATSQSGEVWLAQDGGYAVKFTGQAEGTFNVVTSFTGRITWAYNLTNVNQLTSITLPVECLGQQTSRADLVFPANATGMSQLGLITVFSSPDKPSDVSTFFQTHLPDKGWEIVSVDESAKSRITLQISKADQTLQITITADSTNSGSNVIISPPH